MVRPILLTTFGGLAVAKADGVPRLFLRRKPYALLALLSAEGGSVPRDRAASLLWPEADVERSRHSLAQCVYALRREFEVPSLVTGSSELMLDTAMIEADVAMFTTAFHEGRFEAAVGTYVGPFLEGVFFSGCVEFERWSESMRARCAARFRESAVACAHAAEQEGSVGRAIVLWQRVLDDDPLDGTASATLARLLHRSGQLTTALRVLRAHEQLVAADLGTVPFAEWQRVAETVRSGQTAPELVAVTARTEQLAAEDDTHRVRSSAGAVGPASAPGMASAPTLVAPPSAPCSTEADSCPPPRQQWIHSRQLRATALAVAGGLILYLGLSSPVHGDAGLIAPTSSVRWSGSASEAAGVAVFPFRAVDPASAGASDGDAAAMLLTVDLDGSAGLHAVDIARVTHDLPGNRRLMPAVAASRALHLGARYFVLGEIARGAGRTQLLAAVYAVASPATALVVARASGREELSGIVDSLAIQLLAARSGMQPGRLVQSAARSTRSLTAFRAYLDGESQFRAAHYGAAVAAFRDAVRADSGFALAYYRLATAADWAGEGYTGPYTLHRARALADRLPLRERGLILGAAAWEEGRVADADGQLRRVLELFPGDPEAGYQLGEVIFHSGGVIGRSARDAGPYFARVVEVEPNNVEALGHLARVEVLRGRIAVADSLIERARALRPPDDRLIAELRIMSHMARGHTRWLMDTIAQLRVARQEDLLSIGAWRIESATDSARLGELFASALSQVASSPSTRAWSRVRLGEFAMAEQRLDDALRGTVESGGRDRLLGMRAYFVSLPGSGASPQRLRAYGDSLQSWLTEEPASDEAQEYAAAGGMSRSIAPFVRGLLAARLRDTITVRDMIRQLGMPRESAGLRRLRSRFAWHLRGELARLLGERALALTAFDSAMTGMPLRVRLASLGGSALTRFQRAQLLREMGRTEEAIRWFSTLDSDSSGEVPLRTAARTAILELRYGAVR